MKIFFTLSGLILNTIAALVAIYPLINTRKHVDDDLIVNMDKSGHFTQRKHLFEKKLGITCLSLLAVGFIFQIIGEAWSD